MENDKITPEYIAEQSKLLSDAELIELIENYGEQEYEHGADTVRWDYH